MFVPRNDYLLPKSYRNIALGFFILSIICLAVIFYSVWAKVDIMIVPQTTIIDQELFFAVKAEPAEGTDEISGEIITFEMEGDDVFPTTGTKSVESSDGVVGEVTIINNYSKEQPLVATTRLAAPDNLEKILVRLKENVVVPPGGQVKAMVYAEDPDNFKDISPMKFHIPGLWGPLREKIYAENSENLTIGNYEVPVVVQSDLDNAQNQLKDELYRQALQKAGEQLEGDKSLWPKLVSSKIVSFQTDTALDGEAKEFTAAMKLQIVAVVFDESQLIKLAKNKLNSELSAEQKIINLDPTSFTYAVEDYDLENKTAKIKVALKASSTLGNALDSIDKSELFGLTEEGVKAYFENYAGVSSVEVIFYPAWLKKIPRTASKINLQVAD